MTRARALYRGLTTILIVAGLVACGGEAAGGLMEPQPVSLNGTVRRVDAEVLLPEVTVRASGLTARTTSRGSYQIEGLVLGEAEVSVTHPGFEPYVRRVRIREGSNAHDILLIPIS